MAISYRVDLHDREGNTVFTLPAKMLHSFTYSKFLRSGGNVEVRMHNVERFIRTLGLPEHLDYMWKIYRKDSLFQDELLLDTVGLHRGTQHAQLAAGNWLNYSYGVSMSDMLISQFISKEAGMQSGLITDVVIAYVTDALSVYPSITIGEIDVPSTIQWVGDKSYKMLATVLDELADQDNADYFIDENLVFRWLRPIDNEVVVSNDLGQIKNLIIVANYIPVATQATTLGSGVDDVRLAHTEVNDDYHNQYGEYYNKHKIRASNVKVASEMVEPTLALLDEGADDIIDVQFTITNHVTFRYKKDFDLGHIVSVNFYGRILKVKIHNMFITRDKLGVDTLLVGCKFYNE